MELKELYTAPEAEILCFKAVENLANVNWGISLANDEGNEGVSTPEITPDEDGEA